MMMKRLFTAPALMLIQLYRGCVSPFLPVACRFHPTCSEYAKEALITHGPIRGSMLALYRIVRCNPFAKSGLDPVPPAPTSVMKNERP